MSARTRALAIACVALTIVLLFGGALAAYAAEPPTLGLSALQTLLSNSPSSTVDGHFSTVVQGQTIITIPVKIQGITGGYRAGTSLILFEASGDLIAKYGGIVAGMSGSPIYVNDGGTDKIVGAVSYGDYFTLGGTGLATPIEEMLALEDTYAPEVMPMRRSVVSSGRVIDRVIIAPNPQDFAGAEANGAIVAKPLSSIFIGGIDPSRKPYKALAAHLAKKGTPVVTLGAPLAGLPGDSDSNLATDLVSGASVAALVTRGDLWLGGIGTVTYANGNRVLAYGHPSFWAGDTSLYMTNAWIDGIWPSQDWPYKVGRPTATRGQFTQDRFAGILGRSDDYPAEATITAEAVNTDTHETTATAVYIPRMLLNTGQWDSYLVAAAVSVAAEKLVDQEYISGSAATTTTVKVSDGVHEYTALVPNFYDSQESGDLSWDITEDVYNTIDELQYALDSGTQNLDIESVDLQMSYTKDYRNAQIAGVRVDGSLHAGVNTATVTYVAYGQSNYVEKKVPFSLTSTMPLSGTLRASSTYYYGPSYDDMYYSDSSDESDMGGSSVTTPGPISDWIETIKDAVDYANDTQPNNALLLEYQPYPTSASGPFVVADTTIDTPWFLSGSASERSPSISTEFDETTIDYRDGTEVLVAISGPSKDIKLKVYATVAGDPKERLIRTVTAKYNDDEEDAEAILDLYDFPANTKLRFHTDASDGWLSADVNRTLKVRASTNLFASRTTFKAGKSTTLYADVYPKAAAGAKVTFQYYSPSWHAWRNISTKTLYASSGSARASVSYKPGKGNRKVRALFLGSKTNAASTSNTVVLHVK